MSIRLSVSLFPRTPLHRSSGKAMMPRNAKKLLFTCLRLLDDLQHHKVLLVSPSISSLTNTVTICCQRMFFSKARWLRIKLTVLNSVAASTSRAAAGNAVRCSALPLKAADDDGNVEVIRSRFRKTSLLIRNGRGGCQSGAGENSDDREAHSVFRDCVVEESRKEDVRV
jgi:predicted helicase